MKIHKVFGIVMASAMLLGMGGCADELHGTEMKARFCPENEILTYKPVDFDKTVITIGIYAPCNAGPVELAIEARFPDVDIVKLEQASIPDIQTHIKQPGVQKELEDIIFTGFVKDIEVSNSIFYCLIPK